MRMCTGSPESPAADRHSTGVRYSILLALLLWPAVSAADFQNGTFEQYRSVTPYSDTVPPSAHSRGRRFGAIRRSSTLRGGFQCLERCRP